eukprot:gene4039-5778_t
MEAIKIFVPDNGLVWIRAELVRQINTETFEVRITDEDFFILGNTSNDLNSAFNAVSLDIEIQTNDISKEAKNEDRKSESRESFQLIHLDALRKATMNGSTSSASSITPNSPYESLFPFQINYDSLDGVSDMITMSYLHEANILDNLRIRFLRMLPYTYTGEICIAVNPYQWLDHFYTPELRDKYLTSPKHELDPHVYGTSATAYKGIRDYHKNQSILVSGESGAGKTETVKILLEHISQMAGGVDDSIVLKVLKSNPLLESFGNATTVRNDNSSRFGKFIQLQFDSTARLVGCKCLTYLLEKTRLVTLNKSEKNFHIFYELFASSPSVKEKLFLNDLKPSEFLYTSDMTSYSFNDSQLFDQSGIISPSVSRSASNLVTPLDSWSNNRKRQTSLRMSQSYSSYSSLNYGEESPNTIYEQRLTETLKGLELFGFTANENEELLKALAGILYLGQIDFIGTTDESSINPKSQDALQKFCKLMGLNEEKCSHSMCTRTMNVGQDQNNFIWLSKSQAVHTRDALAKDCYTRLFEYLVVIINMNLSCESTLLSALSSFDQSELSDKHKTYTISLLDIFGFESFQVNRFEQLCINYANEKLQSKFTLDTFVNIQSEYQLEGLDWKNIEYKDNSDVLSLLESDHGVFKYLVNDSKRSVQLRKVEVFDFQKFCSAFANNPIFRVERKPRKVTVTFSIQHFAGRVTYDIEGFRERNTDVLPIDKTQLMQDSTNPIIRKIFNINNHNSVSAVASNSINTNKTIIPNTKTQSLYNNSNSNNHNDYNNDNNNNNNNNNIGLHRPKSFINADTVLEKFQSQLSGLMDLLESTKVHYIRCFKPNSNKSCIEFNRKMVVEQLRYSGMIESIRIIHNTLMNPITTNVL